MALPTRGTLARAEATSTVHTVSVTVASGDGRALVVFINFRKATSETISSVARDGQTLTLLSTVYVGGGTGYGVRLYGLENANAGTADLVVTLSANRAARITAVPYTDCDPDDFFGAVTEAADLSEAYGASVTADQELLGFAAAYDIAGAAGTFTATGTGQTELDDNTTANSGIYAAAGFQNEIGTVTASWTFGAATADEVVSMLIAVNGVGLPPVGPLVDPTGGNTNGSGVLATDLTSDVAGTRVLTTARRNGTVVARITTLPG